ncbi:MAG: hypothetical protein ABRQ27_01340 [Clostridiaceae bacterium]
MGDNKKRNYVESLLSTVEKYISKGKEEELREKISKSIRKKIFSKEIEEIINSRDFSDVIESESNTEDIAFLFSNIFPVYIEENGISFRLFKHKIEIALSDKMKDRFIYIFSEGRLTSGEFKCYRLYDDEYVYIVKKIIQNIDKLKAALKEEIEEFDMGVNEASQSIENSKIQLDKANENSKLLLELLDKID